MNIENDILKKSVIVYEKLINYGFKEKDKKYVISKNILDDSFRIDVEIDNKNNVKGKIYDLFADEEYTNYRIEEQTGEFVNKIRREFEKFLIDIRENCTNSNYFITKQANRITNLIIEKYKDIPEFAWEKNPGNGIFKNSNNNKWYGLIMNINKNKIDDEEGEIEVLNIKLDLL